tara:strand:- start:77 stop:289 length:213 start_codon:yes stop_codon:yes gene_type:complete
MLLHNKRYIYVLYPSEVPTVREILAGFVLIVAGAVWPVSHLDKPKKNIKQVEIKKSDFKPTFAWQQQDDF